MEFQPVKDIEGLLVITPDIYHDDRGFFLESYHAERYSNAGLPAHFAQDNQSVSKANVVRGLHFQRPPFEQGKLVRVIRGRALDVAVDIRKNSPSYGKVYTIMLNAADQRMLWIPPGFAHGFSALEDDTVFLYKCTKPYHRDSEAGIIFNDPDLKIDWHVKMPVVSSKDLELGFFKELESPF
jgi:dTDP-4-dehydrorhamnose 3,5-epimerase